MSIQKEDCSTENKDGEVITDDIEQVERRVEHYLDLYSRENNVTKEALDTITSLPVMEGLDNEPTVEELSKAVDSLGSRKAPGNDAIPREVIKHVKRALLLRLHELLCPCRKEGAVLGTCAMRR